MESDQGGDILKTRPTVCRFLAYGKGFIVAAEGLEDGGAIAIRGIGVERELLGTLEVIQGIRKPMEDGPGPRTCDESCSVSGRVAHELLGDLLGPLVIGNAAEDEPAKRDQLDETNATFDGGATQPDIRLQTVDLRPEIPQRNRAISGRQHGEIGQTGRVCRGAHAEATSGRFGGAM
jgi:hypothetical protein